MRIMENIKSWNGILVYVEVFKSGIHPVSLELIGEAYRLSRITKEPIYAVAVGPQVEMLKEQFQGYPLQDVFLYKTAKEFQANLYEEGVENCIETIRPSIVLIGGTNEGRALAPRIAVHFKTGLTADCTELEVNEDGELLQTRPAFGGNIMASILTQNTRPQFATVRPKVMLPITADFSYETNYHTRMLKDRMLGISILAVEEEAEQESIINQDVLIVAGRGIKKRENLSMLQELAGLLGGKLASSRALVEKGWMSPKDQIGLSGNTVNPRCMITCGVSGTVQFIAGMKNTKNIIAINSDRNARIFEIAHYPICGDIYEIIPELINLIKS